MYVKLILKVPEKLNDKQRKLLKEFDKECIEAARSQ